MAREPYADLAPYYDDMGKDPAIETYNDEWRRSLVAAMARHRLSPRVLVDLACGTGSTTVPWTRRRGLHVVGVDRSAAMLRVARGKSSAVRWYRRELAALDLPERADVVTCHFDALNHVLRDAELQRVFHNVARVLRERGLFQFDLDTRHMLRWLSGRQKLLRVGRQQRMVAGRPGRRVYLARAVPVTRRRSGTRPRGRGVARRSARTPGRGSR